MGIKFRHFQVGGEHRPSHESPFLSQAAPDPRRAMHQLPGPIHGRGGDSGQGKRWVTFSLHKE